MLANAWVRWWRSRFPRKTLGELGEDAAARHLRKQGYKLLGRRVKLGRGDIDLIAADRGTLVFVEVKTRTSPNSGGPEAAVGVEKQRRLTQLALLYMKQHGLLDRSARFDVVAVVWPPEAKRPQIEHYPHAFEAVGPGGFFS